MPLEDGLRLEIAAQFAVAQMSRQTRHVPSGSMR